MSGGHCDIGHHIHARGVPQIDRAPEVELLKLLRGKEGVRLVHEVARLPDAARHVIRLAALDSVVHRRRIRPAGVAVRADHRKTLFAQNLLDGVLGGFAGVGHAHAEVVDGPTGSRAAHAARSVHVARYARQQVAGTVVLRRIARVFQRQHVLDSAIAVPGRRVDARCVRDGRLF